jgi:hypothetical protein
MVLRQNHIHLARISEQLHQRLILCLATGEAEVGYLMSFCIHFIHDLAIL